MALVRRLLLSDQPQETRFFAFLGVFGVVLAVAYWLTSHEPAGTILLLAFGVAGAVAALRLGIARPPRVKRGATGTSPADAATGPHEGGEGAGGGTGGVDRPFLDESGRLPDATLAPLSLGLGIALAMTAIVFGPWLLLASVLPIGWGAWAWLTGARDELDAVEAADRAAGRGAAPSGTPVRRRR